MASNTPKLVWKGEIPACFEVARYEVQTNAAPSPCYAMLPRHAYLTLFVKNLTEAFNSYIEEDKVDEVWFEYKEKPLPWHYPCGLLYDLHCDKSGSDLPWQITVHFQNFPKNKLISCPSQDVVEAHYISMLKEADQLKHKGQVICDMSKNQQQQLWHGLKTNNFDEFWHINKKFMQGYENSLSFKNIPIRFYYQGQIFQQLLNPLNEDESADLTLRDALHLILPTLFQENSLDDSVSVITHGIEPPLSTPLQWLSSHLSYPDNFLHIIVQVS